MSTYGQYCPIAKAMEVLGERWTMLIVRDMLSGARHFNDLARGLPRLSRALLSKRLRQLVDAGVVERVVLDGGARTEYTLTRAGRELSPVLDSLMDWGTAWAFQDPDPDDLDPMLLMWWLRTHTRPDALPAGRVVAQFDFDLDPERHYWLVLARDDVSLCLRRPRQDVDLWIEADLAAFYRVWLGRLSFAEATSAGAIVVRGLSPLERTFDTWFAWSAAADAERTSARAPLEPPGNAR